MKARRPDGIRERGRGGRAGRAVVDGELLPVNE